MKSRMLTANIEVIKYQTRSRQSATSSIFVGLLARSNNKNKGFESEKGSHVRSRLSSHCEKHSHAISHTSEKRSHTFLTPSHAESRAVCTT